MTGSGIKSYKTILIGHSLGAFVAEVLGVLYKKSVITIDSPGSRNHLIKHYKYTDEYLD